MRNIFNFSAHGRKASGVINWFILLTLLVMIILPVMSNFQRLDRNEILNQRLMWLTWYYSILVIMGCYALYSYGLRRLATDRYSIFMSLCLLSFLISILLGGANFKPMMFFAPFFIVLTFHVFKRINSKDNSKIIASLLIVYLLAPLLLYFFPCLFYIPFDLYTLSSFRGFASSRTTYAYAAGIAVLILVARPFPIRWAIVPLLLLGLVLSESRAAILSTLVSIAYLLTFDHSRKYFFRVWMMFFLFSSFFLINYYGGEYHQRQVSMFEYSGGREQIIMASIEKSLDNILFGKGSFYQSVDVGYRVEPHNSILQSVINFGVIPTFFWLLMIGKTYISINSVGRAFLLYWFIFGMFHPGFDAFLFVPESFFALLLAVHFGFSPASKVKKMPKSQSPST